MLSRTVRICCATGLAALALAACGSDDEADASDSSSSDDQFASYIQCLEDEGIDIPDGWSPFGDSGSEMPTDMASGEMPTDMASGDMPTDMASGEMPTDMASGDMPSGGMGGGGMNIEAPEGVDEDDWSAATEACSSELEEAMGEMSGGFNGGGGGSEEATGETTDS